MKRKVCLILAIIALVINGVIFGYEWCDYITDLEDALYIVTVFGGLEVLGAVLYSSVKCLWKGEEKKEPKEL